MRKIIACCVIMAGFFTGCSDTSEIRAIQPNAELGTAQACIRVGRAEVDPVMSNLIDAGHKVAFEKGTWLINDVAVATGVPFEDEAFDACGPVDIINLMEAHQS